MVIIAKYSNTVEYKLKTTLDSSGLTKLQSEIKKVQTELRNMTTYSTSVQLNKPVKEAIKDLDKLQTAIARSYNSKLGMLDTTKLKSNFKDLNLNLSSLQRSFNATGATGQIAFNNLLGRLGNLDTGLKTISKTTDKVMNTLGNTFRWGIIASGFQSIMNSAHEAVQYVKDLDTSLTNIMMVTDYSKQQMNEYAKSANEAAKALGSTTVAMTDATLVFAQQGFDLNKSDQLAQLSTKLANASQQDTATTSDQITAYMNAYGLDSNIEKLSSALDSWAEVANVSAADVQELAAASQKAASTANTVGVNMDQLAAQIATIESVTREAPENIGNGLKTIYARFSDIAMGETLDDGVDLGKVTGTLEKVGVSVLGSDGKMREVGSIMEDLMKVWSNIDSTQKNAIATTLAGKYQLARFEALMNRSDMYNEYKSASQNADGTLDVMNEKYVNSLDGRMNKLQATFEETIGKFSKTDDFYGLIDGLTTSVDLMNQFIDAIGGGKNALLGLGAVAGKVFSTSIGRGINNFISNRQAEKIAKQNAKNAPTLLKDMGLDVSQPRNDDIVNFVQTGLRQQPKMSEEQAKTFNDQKDQLVASRNERIAAETALQEAIIKTNVAYGEEELIVSKVDEETGKMTVNASKLYAQIAEGAGYSVQDVEKMRGSFAKIDNELEKMKQALGLYIEEYLEMPPAIGEASNASKLFTVRTNEILRVVDRLPESTKDTFKNLISQIKEAEADETKFMELLSQLEQEINKTQNAINKGKFLETGTDIGAAFSRLSNAEAADEMATGNAEETLKSITSEQRIQNLTNMAIAVGNLTFAVESFKALGSIWNNDDLEIGDKILQTIMNLSMGITNLGMALSGTVQGAEALKEIFIQRGLDTISLFSNTQAIQQNNAAAIERAITAGEIEGPARQANTAATNADTVATNANTVATNAAAASKKKLIAAFALGAVQIAAVLGVVVALGAGIKDLIDLYNQDANAAKKARDEANTLSESYQNLKTSNEELNKSLESYTEARESLKDLEQGTEDWNKKLKESNDLVISILDKYPELAKYVSTDTHGALRISEEGITKIKEEQETKEKQAYAASLVSDVTATNLEQKASETSLRRRFQDWSPSETGDGSIVVTELRTDQLEKIFALISEDQEKVFDKNTIKNILPEISESLAKSISENGQDFITAYNNRQTKSDANNIKLQQAVLQNMKEQKGYDLEGDLEAGVANVLSRVAESNVDNYKKEIQKRTDEENYQEYADYFGYKIKQIEGDKVTYTDSSGNEMPSVDKDTVQTFLASCKAMQDAANTWESVANEIRGIKTSSYADKMGSTESVNQITSFSSASRKVNLEQYSKAQLQQNGIDITGNNNFSSEDLGVTDELAQQAGFDNAEAFATAYSNAFNEAIKEKFAVDNILNSDDSVKIDQDDKTLVESDSENGSKSEQYQEQRKSILDNVDSVYQLEDAYDKNLLVVEDFDKGLRNLASDYPDLTDKSSKLRKAEENYQKILKKTNATDEEKKEGMLELADAQTELLKAIKVKEWEKARKKLAEYNKTLASGEEDSEEYQDALKQISYTLTDLTDIPVDTEWVEQNKEAVQDWLNGVEGAGAKLDALLNIDNASEQVKSNLENIGVNYDALRNAINTNQISFDVNGHADFSQVMTALTDLDGVTDGSTDKLQLLAAYLQAMGGASLELEQDGATMTIDAPDTSGSPEEVAAAMNRFIQQTQEALSMGWEFSGISLPDSPYKVPTSNTSGSGGSSGGSGGSGGGGGGGGSSYEPKTKDRNKDELDRYKKVDAQLNKIDKTLDKLNTDKERLVGYKWQNAMTKEIKLLYKQIDLQKEKLELQKEEAEEKRNQLANDYGITFDADGIPQNYKEKFQELQNSLNDAIDAYNNSTTEEDQNYWEDIIEQRQKAFDDFKDLIDKYLDVQIDGIEESEKNIQDFYDKIEDMRIEAFKKQIEATDKIKSVNETMLEFQNTAKWFGSDNPLRDMELSASKLGGYFSNANTSATKYYDDLIKQEQKRWHETDDEQEKENAHARAEFWRKQKSKALNGEFATGGDGTGWLDRQLDSAETIFGEIQKVINTGKSDIFGENTEALYEMAEEQYKTLNQTLQDMESEYKNLHQAINDYIDDMVDKAQDRLDMFDQITDELDHQMNIIEQLYGDKSYDLINKALGVQNQNYSNKISELQQQKAVWEELLKTLEVGSDEWKKVNGQIKDAQSELNSLVESSLENMRKQYENTVNKTLDAWTNKVLGGDIDWLADQWELINRNADYYLDKTNKAYNIQKLQSKYLDLLDDASGLDTQHKITEQMNQQLDLLRNKTKLSQYDVEYANAQLEILQKQIALEDAQRNKSQMKLRRDSQGNYSYVYTANEDDVRSVEGDLLDAKNNAYNLSKDNMKQAQDDSLSALQNAKQMLMDIWTDANTTLAEKQERTKWLIENLKEYINSTSEQLSTSQKNIINDFIGMCDSLTDENRTDLEDVYNDIVNGNKDSFDKIDTRWDTSFTKWLQDMDSFVASTDQMYSDLTASGENYQKQVDSLAEKVGQNFKDIGSAIDGCKDSTDALANTTSDFISQLKADSETVSGYENTLLSYKARIAEVEQKSKEYYEMMLAYQRELNSIYNKDSAASGPAGSADGSSGSGGSGSGSESGSDGSGSYSDEDAAWGIAQNIWTYGSWADDPVRRQRIIDKYGEGVADRAQQIVNEYVYSGRADELINPDSDIWGYDTGGYTGSWSDNTGFYKNGKMALLHQKEIVLNETDTQNLLNAVNMIRAMTDGLKTGALNSALSSINSFNGMNSQSSQDLEQNIHIDANFPNVKDASEIEQAILSLADQATQYIHKIR